MKLTRINPAATAADHDRALVVDAALVRAKAAHAAANPRLRDIHILHRGDPDTLQRMVNAVQPRSYVQPHRHLHPPKAECFVLLAGRCGFAIFDDDGALPDDGLLLLDRERGALAVDIREGVWHALVALAPDTALFEVKPGPYSQAADKDFAPWAPLPGTPEADAWTMRLAARFRTRFGLPG